MFTVIAVDISGRHRIDAGYYMVCAAASVEITPTSIEKINEINTEAFLFSKPPELLDIVKIIENTAAKIKKKGALIVERGDLFNLDENLSKPMFTQEIRYQESIGERKAIELAHYVSLSTRNLLLKETGLDIRIHENDEDNIDAGDNADDNNKDGADVE
ncbi:DUF2209 domain-containing protein [Methanimicrococcus blatticola]|uniref:DUF2209 domain-containing protein n=1 Tax=Methanimicrococcus blatticola TaxID=91560 RepID=A0A484F2X5_9EURY|nr:DUF2209 domain-containing protein [Methanimicrococcus blatticola]MBZ3935248.1 DUF2209 family protein [Methanimicrococcus blatticola]MCC2508654.1 DUF2209 domain-containing protein [Methanimicrococcus blatticola]TDQ67960.1 hypothetical protein C7391_1514 [Methanimicrococcus blatticola]